MDVIDLIVRDVAELPDRDSPDDWPEAMLVTADELRSIVENRLHEECGITGREVYPDTVPCDDFAQEAAE